MIQIENLKKTFGSHQVLNGVSATISDHEIVGVIGPSGSGKSTLLRCLGGIEKIDGGSFTVKGKLGMVFQTIQLECTQQTLTMKTPSQWPPAIRPTPRQLFLISVEKAFMLQLLDSKS